MPRKNTRRRYERSQVFHIYNRGVAKQCTFRDINDFHYFLELLTEHTRTHDLSVLAFCLMTNHFHLILYSYEPERISNFMHDVLMEYVGCFNKRHARIGALFDHNFRAVAVTTDAQLSVLTRYIHRNPKSTSIGVRNYPWSSLRYYLGKTAPEWLNVEMGLAGVSREQYHALMFESEFGAA